MRPPCIVRNIQRPDRAIAAELAELGVATVHESQSRSGLMGVVVVPPDDAARVLGAGRAREAKEEISRARIGRGELSLDYNNLRDVLARERVVYIN